MSALTILFSTPLQVEQTDFQNENKGQASALGTGRGCVSTLSGQLSCPLSVMAPPVPYPSWQLLSLLHDGSTLSVLCDGSSPGKHMLLIPQTRGPYSSNKVRKLTSKRGS